MTTTEKLKTVQSSPELLAALGILNAVFKDCGLKSHIRFTYTVEGKKYEITFLPIENEVTYNSKKTGVKWSPKKTNVTDVYGSVVGDFYIKNFMFTMKIIIYDGGPII